MSLDRALPPGEEARLPAAPRPAGFGAPLLALALALALAAVPAPAQGIGTPPLGESAHPPALSIGFMPDSNFIDWWPALTNRDNVFWDEIGGGVGACPTDDADCPRLMTMPPGDLRRVAWSHDATGLAFFVERQVNPFLNSGLLFYFDEDLDGLMEDSERVVVVTWEPGGRVVAQQAAYRPTMAGGDPFTNMGEHDGYPIPGTVLIQPPIGSPVSCANCGSVDGLSMEFGIPWSWLASGGPKATGLHVSSATNLAGAVEATPANLFDNLGGDLLTHSGRVEARSEPLQGAPGDTVTAVFRVYNLGNQGERFELSAHSEQGLPVRILRDGAGGLLLGTDANGDGDFDDAADSVAVDGSGDGRPDTGQAVNVGSFRDIGLEITIPAGAEGFVDRLELTARPAGDASRPERAQVAVHGGTVTLSRDGWRAAAPAATADHLVTVTNNGASATQVEFDFSGAWPWSLAQDDGGGNPGVEVLDSDADGRRDLDLSAGQSLDLHLLVDVPPGEMPGSSVDVSSLAAEPDSGPAGASTVRVVTAVFDEATVKGRYEAAAPGGPAPTAPGALLWYAHEFINAHPKDGLLYLFSNNAMGDLAPPLIFSDPNGDGVPDDGELLDLNDGFPVAGGGGRFPFVVATQVRTSVTPGSTVGTDTFADLEVDGSIVDGVVLSDRAAVGDGIAARTPTWEVQSPAFSACDVIFATTAGGPASPTEFVWDAPSGEVRRQRRWTDLHGTTRDSRPGEPDDEAGDWTADDGNGTAAWVLERSASITLDGVEIAAGGSALIPRVLLENTQAVAAFTDYRLESLVLNDAAVPGSAGGEILQSDGTNSSWVAYDGDPATLSHSRALRRLPAGEPWLDRFGMRGASLPGGDYQLHVRLVGSCEAVVAEQTLRFTIDVPTDCDGDGVVDGADNCECVPNPGQEDADGDGVGDACDNCVDVGNAGQADADMDGRGDACDACPFDPSDRDTDGDGYCDDGDGSGDSFDNRCNDGAMPGDACDDNCNALANDQADMDDDGLGDPCDPCPTDPDNNCIQLDVLRNDSLTSRSYEQVWMDMILDPGGDPAGPPRLDPAADLYQADVGALTEVRVAGDALVVGEGNAGVVIYYEVTNTLGPLRVAKDGDDVVLTGW